MMGETQFFSLSPGFLCDTALDLALQPLVRDPVKRLKGTK